MKFDESIALLGPVFREHHRYVIIYTAAGGALCWLLGLQIRLADDFEMHTCKVTDALTYLLPSNVVHPSSTCMYT